MKKNKFLSFCLRLAPSQLPHRHDKPFTVDIHLRKLFPSWAWRNALEDIRVCGSYGHTPYTDTIDRSLKYLFSLLF